MDKTDLDKDDEGFSYQNMVRRDQRRWGVADVDGDGALTRGEFAGFLHPEETGHMRDIVVLETLEDIDKDKDGRVSLEEYIGNIATFLSIFAFPNSLYLFMVCLV